MVQPSPCTNGVNCLEDSYRGIKKNHHRLCASFALVNLYLHRRRLAVARANDQTCPERIVYDRPLWWQRLSPIMTRKRGNPNWGRPILPAPALASQFELKVMQLRLTPEMYVSSRELRLWCQLNSNRCYVPEWLLAEWRITVDLYFSEAA